MAEQSPDNEFDEAAALAAARRAVDAAFAEGVRDQVEDAFPPEAHAEAANPAGVTSTRIGDGGVAEHVRDMPPASAEDFASHARS